MWMMGYNDGGDFNMPDAFSGRKLRPLMPRPAAAAVGPPPPNTSPSLSRIHATDFIAINHHLVSTAMAAEQNKRDHFNTQQVVVSSRWNPTPEQLQTLEELYRRGTRTPSAEQIQHITAQLRRYGKIEGKNVFYWFQNHKARERQKRRRQLESATDDNPRNTDHNPERKESSGASRTGFEVEQTKNWATPTNCSTFPEKGVSSIQRAAKAAAVAECRADHGWVHFDEEAGLQQRRNHLMERNDTWQTMMHHHQFSNCSSPPLTNLIINIPNNTSAPTSTSSTMLVEKRVNKPASNQDLNIGFIAPFRETDHVDNGGRGRESEVNYEESQTLQLFPLTSGDAYENAAEKETQVSTSSSMDATIDTPYQFFEFLPLKN